MQIPKTSRRRAAIAAASTVVAVAGGLGIASAATQPAPNTTSAMGRGVNEFGMTKSFYKGTTVSFTYTKGFFCDNSVSSAATTNCEVGQTFNKPPSKQYDPLYITVPLGFTQGMNMIECPSGLVCVDHPGTVDLTRLEPALKPLYPTLTKKQLLAALKNFATPEHDHFITDTNHNKPEWWDVEIVGVTSPKVFADIRAHRSFAYIQNLIKAKNPNVLGPIPSNLFLYFGVQG